MSLTLLFDLVAKTPTAKVYVGETSETVVCSRFCFQFTPTPFAVQVDRGSCGFRLDL